MSPISSVESRLLDFGRHVNKVIIIIIIIKRCVRLAANNVFSQVTVNFYCHESDILLLKVLSVLTGIK